ncbi:sirohydrochlorin cobaltochelatase [Acetonema longum]
MQKLMSLGVVMILAVMMVAGAFQGVDAAPAKKAILVVSFGTTFAETRQNTIEAIEKKVQQTFPDYEVRRVFTSNIVRKNLAANDNLHVDDLVTALNKLKNEGFTHVVVQSTHIIPGEEFEHKIVDTVAKYKNSFQEIVIGRPMLYFEGQNPDDYQLAVKALQQQLPKLKKGEAVVLMGHGTPEHKANANYQAFQDKLKANKLPVYIGTVEAAPTLEDVEEALRANKIKKVILMPFMIVAGDHANNDMAGDESDSWKSILTEKGYKVEVYLTGLGANPAVQDIYVQHVKDAIAGMKL